MCGGGGGGGGKTVVQGEVDKAYNKGLLEIAREDQEFRRMFINMFTYGVLYDPTERGAYVDGKWVSEDDKEFPKDAKITTRGEAEGYDPEAATSEMQYLQNLIEANQALLGAQTKTELSELDLQEAKNLAEKELLGTLTASEKARLNALREQAWTAGERAKAERGLIPEEIKKALAELGLATETAEMRRGLLPYEAEAAMADLLYQKGFSESQLRLLGPQEQTALAQLIYQKSLAESQGRLLPAQEDAALKELAYKAGLSESQLRLLGPQEATALAQLAYAQESAESGRRILPAEERAALAGLQYQTGLSQTRYGLLSGQGALARQQMAAQSDFIREAQKGVDAGQWANQAQAGVQHAYKLAGEAIKKDIGSYGLDPSAGRYASQRREMEMGQAAGVAGARTEAQRAAESENLRRKQMTTGLIIPTI